MSLTLMIVLMVLAWLSVAAAMLWGVLRVSRRRHPAPRGEAPKAEHKSASA
ncbi:hypothetical protein SFA35_09810 [Pseudomonas sp. HR96]|uniref:hypothetical protein n=1 Tax=Pseudomonas sp. HR96 TaxID=1027966 RepID=UPI002A762EFA|nr:hypothetical protein [Pseudomonas sp. HR96]WPP01619.1 hypothetical protein SFA35_09810 [Pseudomonas sp. HR96]